MAVPIRLFIAVLSPAFVISLTYCQKGTYYVPLKNTHACELCAPGTFMPFPDHKNTSCIDCMKIEDNTLEILIKECDKEHNSVIHCVEGYYRRRPKNIGEKERCVKCSRCDGMYEILPCRPFKNTHCCMEENYDVVPNHDGVPVCVDKPWLCKRGEFFNEGNYLCEPCPKDTYMPSEYHSLTECIKCHRTSSEKIPRHAIIKQPCNSTHQAVIGCEDGFFINHTMGRYKRDIGCSPCKTCNSDEGMYEGRECNSNKDTACCPNRNMTVVDTPGGPECRSLSTDSPSPEPRWAFCGEGSYLNVDNSRQTMTCLPCPRGTFMDESPHNNTACTDCTEFNGEQLPSTCQLQETVSNFDNIAGIVIGSLLLGFLGGGLLVFGFIHRGYIYKMICSPAGGRKRKHKYSDTTDERELENIYHLEENYHEAEKEKTIGKTIPMREFSLPDLPEAWRVPAVENYVKTTADLTVLINTRFNMKERLAPHRSGSGLVHYIKRIFTKNDGSTCPCKQCVKSPGQAKTNWCQVQVATSSMIVTSDEDAENTTCYLWYDDGDDVDNCSILHGVRILYENERSDVCTMICISHDEGVSDKLEYMMKLWDGFRTEIREKMKAYTGHMPAHMRLLTIMVSYLDYKKKHVTLGHPRGRKDCFPYELSDNPGSFGAPVNALDYDDGDECTITLFLGWVRKDGGGGGGLALP